MRDCIVGDAECPILAASQPSISSRPVGKRYVLAVAYQRQAVLIWQPFFNADPKHKNCLRPLQAKFCLRICPQNEDLSREYTAASPFSEVLVLYHIKEVMLHKKNVLLNRKRRCTSPFSMHSKVASH